MLPHSSSSPKSVSVPSPHRHLSPNTNEKGKEKGTEEIDWVVSIGAFDEDSKEGEEEMFWELVTPAEEVMSLLEVKGGALKGDKLLERVKEKWEEGELAVMGYKGVRVRASIQLQVIVTPTYKIELNLQPTSKSPISLLSILATAIPLSLTSSKSQLECEAATTRLKTLQTSYDRTFAENKDLKEKIQKLRTSGAGGTGSGRGGRMGESSQGQSQAGPSQSGEKPTGGAKAPAPVRRKVGGAGRIVEDAGFGADESDSD